MPLFPLFKRPDGDLVTGESDVRRMIPYLMLGRNESVVYHELTIDMTKTRPWLVEYNKNHPRQPASLFHLCLWAAGRGLHTRNGMNRFVSGGRIYQRKKAFISFAAKKKFSDDSPLVTVKLEMLADEPFEKTVDRVQAAIENGRSGAGGMVEAELKLALALPGFLLGFIMSLLRLLDRWNLMPRAMIETDPMFTSVFMANLGSVGIDRTFHHLYEYGNASLFGVIGVPKKTVFVGRTGQPEVRDAVDMRWSFDERINDGFYCAATLKQMGRLIEDPEKHAGSAKGTSQGGSTDGSGQVAV